MKKAKSAIDSRAGRDQIGSQLMVADIVRYLTGVASLQQDKRTGNIELSRALQFLSHCLEPYSDLELCELLVLLGKLTKHPEKAIERSSQYAFTGADDLRVVSQGDIEAILDQDDYTKKQLVELGSQRFGISRAKLNRLRKKDAIESIRAALEHEKSLDVISEEARRAGERGVVNHYSVRVGS